MLEIEEQIGEETAVAEAGSSARDLAGDDLYDVGDVEVYVRRDVGEMADR